MWSWKAAKDGSLSGCSVHGINTGSSKIAAEVERITLLDACEIINCTGTAADSIRGAKWD